MKVATWNVNSIRTRQDHVIRWLTTNPVDVLCLQETKVADEKFPSAVFENLGYSVYFSGQKSYNGVAIFSRTPLESVTVGFSPIVGEELTADLDDQKRVISGVVNNVRIVNLYVPNGSSVGSEKYHYKLRWLAVLKAYLEQLRNEVPSEMCVCGDFNVAIADRDIHNPKGKENSIMASPVERQALKDVLDVGLADVFRKFTQESGHYTWWDYRTYAFQGNRGWRIDYHYLTPQLYEKAVNCWIDIEPRKLEKPSDHTPVIVEF
ncbi:MAG: exodeoxyribonuclease III [Halothece sp.]